MSLLHDLFKTDDRPGPGVAPDEPRKKGLRRLLEVCARDLAGFFWAGLLACAGLLPWLALTLAATFSRALLAAALAGAVGGLIAAPGLCALADLILRGLRDEPFYWWSAWRKAWRGSLRAAAGPGAVLGALAALERLAVQLVLEGGARGVLWGAAAGLFLLAGLLPYLCAQLVLFDQPLARSLKNSLLLFLAALPRSLAAAAILLGYAALIALLTPASYLLLILGNLWLPAAAALLAIYRPMEQTLALEARVRQAQEARRGGQEDPSP